jgi:H+/Cl- antiporter ClcA
MGAGIAAGVGSIFRVPLAGALFAAEFPYRDPEFEYEVIIPAGMASVVAYCLFCISGSGGLFGPSIVIGASLGGVVGWARCFTLRNHSGSSKPIVF